jgi:protein-tyrosine-phosphatase/predicted ATP-grasp superfamily ATP-dependent carboligase
VTDGRVLVLGDDTRSFLTIVRSLGRRGVIVHAAPANFRSPALRSRYISAIHELPPWMGEDDDWLAALTQLIERQRYDLVIPCDERLLLPLQRHRRHLSAMVRLAMPDDRAIAALFDKHETRELARRLGVPVAPGRLLRADDTAEELLSEFGAPLVVKPRRSYWLGNLAARGKPEVLSHPTRLALLLQRLDPKETLVEQYFTGQGVGVSVLAARGRMLQMFEHHRVREIAGASFYRSSAPLSPELAAACEAIAAALDYTGVAMFEFKRDPSGDWILLEVNARPWGSMPLPVALGVDFPYRWYRLLVSGEETPAVAYRVGIYGRNLVPDLRMSLVEAAARGRAATACFMIGRGAELLRVFSGREVHDVLVRDDLRPGLVELREITRGVQRHAAKLVPGGAALRRRRARAMATAQCARAVHPLVMFVCQGNICRSPFAAALLRARLGERGISIGSAGMMPLPGRPTPSLGLTAAAAFGIDLAAHRSAWLTRHFADAASLLIVFDQITRDAVLDRYPQVERRLMLLGDVAALGEIPDPIDSGAAGFEQVYNQIALAIAELVPLLAARQRSGKSHQPLARGEVR